MKYLKYIILALLISCGKNEPQVVLEKISAEDIIRTADSIALIIKSTSSGMDEIQLRAEDNDINYIFANAYSKDGQLMLIAEQTGNDSMFFEKHYFVDINQNLMLYEAKGTSMTNRTEVHKRKTYFYKDSVLKDRFIGLDKHTDEPAETIARYRKLIQEYNSKKSVAGK